MNQSSFSSESRVRALAIVFGIVLIIMTTRLLFMQTVEHEKYYNMSEENRIRIVPTTSFRGIVYDRNGLVLVENKPSYTISAIPNEINDYQLIADRLAQILPIPSDVLKDRIYEKRFFRYQPIRIARSVDFETVCKIEENADKYQGIIFQLAPARKYPPQGVLSHAVGYTSEVSELELKDLKSEGVNFGSQIGRDGIEKYWDRYLRGRDGLDYLEITAGGKILGNLKEKENIPAVSGKDLILSLDYDLQKFTVSLFEDTLAGACVALDPRNGEILTFVSLPAFDANLFSGVLKQEDWNKVRDNPQKPLLNRVIKGEYPPASPYKLVVAGASLEEGIIDRDTRFASCRGGYRFGNRVFKCWNLSGHGSLGVVGSIEQSCDVYYYQLGQKLGLAKFAEYSRKCGFGSATNIDIPGERAGLVPDYDWYDRRYGKGKWPVSVILNLSIGQGEVLSTPLQLANFFAALGNGGVLYRPHFLRSVIEENDTNSVKIEVLGNLPFSDETLAILKESCVGVLYAEKGTARASKIDGIVYGGKTGTAQNPHGNEHSWFCAFAPADDPIIAVAVIVENAGHGSEIAAPIVSKVIRHYLETNEMIPRIDSTLNPIDLAVDDGE
jgi:penicillin-binding protein 2